MFGIIHPARKLAEHHEHMLVLKLRTTVDRTAFGSGRTPRAAPAPGLEILASHERNGRVARIVALHAPDTDGSGSGRRGTLKTIVTGLAGARGHQHRHRRVLVVELESGVGVDETHRALRGDPHVEFVSRVPARYLCLAAAGRRAKTAFGDSVVPPVRMWNLHRIRWHEARALPGFRDANAIRVAVLDSGVAADHPDLRGRVGHYAHRYPDHQVALSARDFLGHGTHVSGIIAAAGRGALAARGVCRCRLMMWKVFGDVPLYDSGYGSLIYQVDPVLYRRALAGCLERRADVVNMSLGGPAEPDPQEQRLYDELLERGTVLVAAMGNARAAGSPVQYPAALPGVIAVGATGVGDVIAPFSSRGRHIALCAPGTAIWSTLPTYPGALSYAAEKGPRGSVHAGRPFHRNVIYDAWPGTSAAAPQVSAAAALLLANRGRAGCAEVRDQLMKTADRVPAMRRRAFDPDYGAGRLNLLRALTE